MESRGPNSRGNILHPARGPPAHAAYPRGAAPRGRNPRGCEWAGSEGPCRKASSSTWGRSPASEGGARRRCAAGARAEGTPAASAASCTAAPEQGERPLDRCCGQTAPLHTPPSSRGHSGPAQDRPRGRDEQRLLGETQCIMAFRLQSAPKTDGQLCRHRNGSPRAPLTPGSLGFHSDPSLSWVSWSRRLTSTPLPGFSLPTAR